MAVLDSGASAPSRPDNRISAAPRYFCQITLMHSTVPEGNNVLKSKIIKRSPDVFVFRSEFERSPKAEEGEEREG